MDADPAAREGGPPTHRLSAAASLALVILVAGAIALPMLGWAGLSSSEGHRAIPGWSMLASGDFGRITLFEAPYLRKPPGMPWAIATTSAVLGMNEFAARLPSALGFIAMTALAWWFGRRWFGPGPGLVAGLAQALSPAMWPWARSAEIECLSALAAQASGLLIIDLFASPSARGKARWRRVALGVAIAGMGLVKGPAGAPVALGALGAVCLVNGSLRPLVAGRLWAALLLAAALLAGPAWLMLRARAEPDAVTQGVSEFLWSRERLGGIALVIPMALLAGLPGTLALLFPWGPDARREGLAGQGEFGETFARARAVALACLLAMGVYALAGVSNHRYLLPALALVAPLTGYVFAGLSGAFRPARRAIARACFLGLPRGEAIAAVMIVTAGVWIPLQERSRDRNSARAAAVELAAHVSAGGLAGGPGGAPGGAEVIGGDALDARPELGCYLQRAAPAPAPRVRWRPGSLRAMTMSNLPPAGTLLLVRTDEGSRERAAIQTLIDRGAVSRLAESSAGGYGFALMRVERADRQEQVPPPAPAQP